MTIQETSARLLKILEVEAEPPGLRALRRLTTAFITKIPFDNIAKLLSLEGPPEDRIPPFEKFVEYRERYQIGGTCLTNNPYFCVLLRHLGYQAELCGANMAKQNVHTCVGVVLNGRRFHVDVGYGAHLLEPIDVNSLPAEVRLGSRRYQLEALDGRVKLSVWDENKWIHGYLVNPGPISPDNFDSAVADSYLPESTFLNCLRIVRQTAGGMLSLMNKRLTTISTSGVVSNNFDTLEQMEECVAVDLGMPDAPLRPALEVLEKHSGVTLF